MPEQNPAESARAVFVLGSTGYIGSSLVRELLQDGHVVTALVRSGSGKNAPSGCSVVTGDALDGSSYAGMIAPSDTIVHLIGVPHPNPSKADLFRTVDLASVQAMVPAAIGAGVRHIIYVSVAHPAPIMRVYQEIRIECERLISESGIPATILRPWYVTGPGHRWVVLLKPVYWIAGLLPWTREGSRRLGTVRLDQLIGAIRHAVSNPPVAVRIFEVSDIRGFNR